MSFMGIPIGQSKREIEFFGNGVNQGTGTAVCRSNQDLSVFKVNLVSNKLSNSGNEFGAYGRLIIRQGKKNIRVVGSSGKSG